MIEKMEKNAIITLKLKGKSNRWIAKECGIDRKTVARYWDEYKRLTNQLNVEGEKREIQEALVSAPKYNISNRQPYKYNVEIDEAIDRILESEAEKARELGESHKQKLTIKQIHQMVREAGHDIGITMVGVHIRQKRPKKAEAYIRQEYEYGTRIEYDFGEVRLVVNGLARKYYLAVFGSPRGKYRWAYLYRNQKKEVFLDSHVRFFEKVGGVYGEAVYDNMKNVVSRFIGRNEKELNSDLVALSTYYGFKLNVTNCYHGNEKGYVESSVKTVRQEVFAVRYRFESEAEAEQYLEAELIRMNAESCIEEEKKYLLPWRPPLELSQISEQRVDKYGFVRVSNNYYSVPEYLVGRKVMVRSYVKELVVYSGLQEVCRHSKKDGKGETTVNILHYLDTLSKKPGAVRNSVALRSEAELKAVFEAQYTDRPREFIDIIRASQDKPMKEVARIARVAGVSYGGSRTEEIGTNVMRHTRNQLQVVSDFFMKGGAEHGD